MRLAMFIACALAVGSGWDTVRGLGPESNEPKTTNTPTTQPTPQPRPASSFDREAAFPGFTGSAHDFFGPDAPLETRCGPCHAIESSQPVFLWDPNYVRRRRLAGRAARRGVADSTALCLSCHDGSIASDIVGGGWSPDLFAGGAQIAVRRDHPVGVKYPRLGRRPGGTRREYHPLARLKSRGDVKLPDGRVECISCHDPHNALGQPAMLVMSNRRSALCLTCHAK